MAHLHRCFKSGRIASDHDRNFSCISGFVCCTNKDSLWDSIFHTNICGKNGSFFWGGAGDSFCNGQVNPIYLLCTSKCHWSFFLNMQNLCSSILLSQRKTCFLFPKPITVHCVEFYWWRNELDKVKRLLQTSRVECL